MNMPSLKTLQWFENAKELRRILKMRKAELSAQPAAIARIRECFTMPKWYDIRLTCLNEAGNFHGVEGYESSNGNWVTFLNAGDSYAPTIIYWRGTYRVQSLGSFIETMERQRIVFK